MLRVISNWFEPVEVSGQCRRSTYVLLWLIVGLGAVLRFWNLGYAGLHGDEDIMALAARGVLEHGIPILPSEMVYARAPLHTYIMAGSMHLFGDTEWAIRFPSALVGSFCGLLAFFMGKRFLEPGFNLVFVALITFSPSMIEIAQTGRMYVFLVACLLGFGALLFRWEFTSSPWALVSATLIWMLGLLFHALAIFAAPLFLFPGLSRQSGKMLIHGGIAMVVGYVFFEQTTRLIRTFYPDPSERASVSVEEGEAPLELVWSADISLLIGVIIAIGLAILLARVLRSSDRTYLIPSVLLLGIGVVACGFLHYHVGGIALLLGTIAWFRSGAKRHSALVLVFVAVTGMAAIQFVVLYSSGEFPGRSIIGAFIGMPSIWPPLRFAGFTPIGSALYAAALGLMMIRFARGAPLPIHVLFFAMAVWAPLFGIGLFTTYPAMRYMLGVLPFFLLTLVAGLSYLLVHFYSSRRSRAQPAIEHTMALALVLLIVNPLAVERAASNDYRTQPDHKGAAEFIRTLGLSSDDILIAEDSINQTYYLGKVDYRLKPSTSHAIKGHEAPLGMYTGTPFIVSTTELEELFSKEGIGKIYILGSAEGILPERRGAEIAKFLESDRLETIYEGRDGTTKVWRVIR